MAVWQFKFSLVPVDGISRVHGGDTANLQFYRTLPEGPNLIDDADALNYWDDPDALRRIADTVSNFLPEIKSWSPQARMFGEGTYDQIEVWDSDLDCRIDMRNFSVDFLENVLELAREYKCKIAIHGSGDLVSPNLQDVLAEIKKSNAYQFCLDPRGYLNGL